MGLVQSSGKKQQDNMPSGSVTFNAASNFTAGNTVIITVANFTSAGITGITVSGTAAVLDATRTDAGGQNRTQIWRASNVAGGSSAVVISAATGNYITCGFDEWDDIVLSSPLDQTGSTGDTTSASPSATTSGATTQANELVYAVFTDYAGGSWTSATPPSGYTESWEEPDGSAHSGGSAAYRVISSTGVQTATFTTGASLGWISAIATYKLAGGGGGGGGSAVVVGTWW